MLVASGAGQRPLPLLVGVIGLIIAIYGVYAVGEAEKDSEEFKPEMLISAQQTHLVERWQTHYQIALRNKKADYLHTGCPESNAHAQELEEKGKEIFCLEWEMAHFKQAQLPELLVEKRAYFESKRRDGWMMIIGGSACFLINVLLLLIYSRFWRRNNGSK